MEPKKRKNRRPRVTISRMRRHVPFEPIAPILACGVGARRNQPCNFFLKIDPRVLVMADPELWDLALTLLVVLTTLSHYRVSV